MRMHKLMSMSGLRFSILSRGPHIEGPLNSYEQAAHARYPSLTPEKGLVKSDVPFRQLIALSPEQKKLENSSLAY